MANQTLLPPLPGGYLFLPRMGQQAFVTREMRHNAQFNLRVSAETIT